MRAVIGGCLVAVALVSSPAHGQTKGETFFDFHMGLAREVERHIEQQKESFIRGYFRGLNDGLTTGVLDGEKPFCPPFGIQITERIFLSAFQMGAMLVDASAGEPSGLQQSLLEKGLNAADAVPFVAAEGLRMFFPCN